MPKTLNKKNIMAEINITPFTDVILVLLIIFMVTTPLIMQAGISIKLPKTQTQEAQTEDNVTIMLTEDNKLYINDIEIKWGDVEGAIKTRLINDKNKLVVIKADENVKHGRVIELLDTAKTVGAKRIAIATEPKRKGKEK